MRRRALISFLGRATATWPLAALAQQAATPLIGFLSSRSENDSRYVLAAFLKGLNEGGFVEGQNITIEYRWAQGHYEQLPALATDLVNRGIALLGRWAVSRLLWRPRQQPGQFPLFLPRVATR
jgi:putative tryptophan/tyrosine transport system substrate-binding protein